MSEIILLCDNENAPCKPACTCPCDTCIAVRYIGRLESAQASKYKEVLRLAVAIVEWRSGDISTEDGCFAVTDLDTMIELESALCTTFATDSDNATVAEIGPKIDALSTTPEGEQ